MIAKIPYWLYISIGFIIVLLLFMFFCPYSYEHKPESKLYGSWEKVDSEDGYNGHILTFTKNHIYHNSINGDEGWNYQYIEPDSLILYHHGFYEERYKILHLSQDTLTIRLSEYIFHTMDNGIEIESDYIGDNHPIYTYIHLNTQNK